MICWEKGVYYYGEFKQTSPEAKVENQDLKFSQLDVGLL